MKALQATDRWELGGEYHSSGIPSGPFLEWPSPRAWFPLGRDAVLSLWRQQNWFERTLLVPQYLCADALEAWQIAGVRMRFYADDPRRDEPDWSTLQADAGDVVMAVGYFGVRGGQAWNDWHQSHAEMVLLEDHSHDPLSSWARNSRADFAFASVRKTFPVPDGAILWSPRQREMPPEPQSHDWTGSALKLAGMIYKSDYLAGEGDARDLKAAFRRFQVEGEQKLIQTRRSSISPWSRYLLDNGYPLAWRERREENARYLLDAIDGIPDVKPLYKDWPDGHCPFNVVVEFPTAELCAACRQHLCDHGIFAAMHWPLAGEVPQELHSLSHRIRTIPTDHRYTTDDLDIVVDCLRAAMDGRSLQTQHRLSS